MKKQLLVAALLMGTIFTTKAQEQLFSVDFSDVEVLSDWYLIDADGDGFAWGVNTTEVPDAVAYGFEGGFAFSQSWDQDEGPLTPDNSLITQAFTVPVNGGYASFDIGGFDDEFYLEHYAVYVITEEEAGPVLAGLVAEPATATTEDFMALLETASLEETVGTPNATTRNISLADYSGQEVRLVFRHFDVTDQFYLFLDNVTVTSGAMATDNVLASQFSVFPNPAANVINIANADNIAVNAVSIVDINGRTVKSANFDGVAEAQINISDLSAGVYLMNISSDKGMATKKIVKN